MKKIWSVVLVVACLTVLAMSCPVTAAQEQITINVFNWGEYISDGSDGTLDVNAEFEKRTGIKVNYSNFETNEAMYSKLKNGGASYDIVIPSDYMIARLIKEDIGALQALTGHLGVTLAHIPMGSAVEAVTANLIFLIIFIRNGKHIRLGRHGQMEAVIEHRHLRHIFAQHVDAGTNALQVSRIVQRGKIVEALDPGDHALVHQAGFIEQSAALHDTMPHRGDLAHGIEHLALALAQHLLHLLKSAGVSGKLNLVAEFTARVGRAADRTARADALANALCDHALVGHIKQLIFQRRAACVDYQNLHSMIPPVKVDRSCNFARNVVKY